MPALKNPKHEKYAELLAKGIGQGEAYEMVGYQKNDSHASRLARTGKIEARVAELRERTIAKVVEKTAISRIWVLDMLRENLQRAMCHKAVLGSDGLPIGEYTYNGNVANRALELIGKEIGMFIDRKEFKHSVGEFDKMSDAELVQALAREAQALLIEHQSDDGEDN
jgi:phage terminase small subunit